MRNRKLVAWCALVGTLAALGYAQRFGSGKPPRNALFHYDIAIGELITYLIIFAFFLWIARGLSWNELGVRRPRSWWRALGLGLLILVIVFIGESALEPLLHPSREQGLEPTGWQSNHVGAFAISAFAVVVLGPLIEELLFRGLGFRLLERWGAITAVLGTAVAFAFWHGLVQAWPALFIFGVGIAVLRLRTGSILPGYAFHAFFNAAALAVAFAR